MDNFLCSAVQCRQSVVRITIQGGCAIPIIVKVEFITWNTIMKEKRTSVNVRLEEDVFVFLVASFCDVAVRIDGWLIQLDNC